VVRVTAVDVSPGPPVAVKYSILSGMFVVVVVARRRRQRRRRRDQC